MDNHDIDMIGCRNNREYCARNGISPNMFRANGSGIINCCDVLRGYDTTVVVH